MLYTPHVRTEGYVRTMVLQSVSSLVFCLALLAVRRYLCPLTF